MNPTRPHCSRWRNYHPECGALPLVAGLALAAVLTLVLVGCALRGPVWELGAIDPQGRLVLVDTVGRARPLTRGGGVLDFSWSPDGRRVAYVRQVPGGGRESHLLEVGSGSDAALPPRRPTAFPGWSGRPTAPGWARNTQRAPAAARWWYRRRVSASVGTVGGAGPAPPNA
ncbi:MAG: DPP IV N-terminal domain-containing protein, partial [Acetobacteraceae bacterium]|nr:DPP IV N-terminal domain-containing protein [Acetobacteraceae bacterium]